MKVYRSKDKYIVYLPDEVVSQLGLHEKDDVDFFKLNTGAFLFAKKGDVAKLITGLAQPSTAPQQTSELSNAEIEVLKKLDSLRFPQRTESNVAKLLGADEKRVLEGLLKKRAVGLLKGGKEGVYSINNTIYMKFLMRKKEAIPKIEKEIEQRRKLKKETEKTEETSVKRLEKDGYVVLQTEVEAGELSKALEESIRQGLVLGTRSFNKKFYIVLKSFFEKNGSRVVKELRSGPTSIAELSKKLGIDDGAARAILYLMAEQGEVSERRSDVFSLT